MIIYGILSEMESSSWFFSWLLCILAVLASRMRVVEDGYGLAMRIQSGVLLWLVVLDYIDQYISPCADSLLARERKIG